MIAISWKRTRIGWMHLSFHHEILPTIIIAYDSHNPWHISGGIILWPFSINLRILPFEFSLYWRKTLHYLPPTGPEKKTLRRKILCLGEVIQFVLQEKAAMRREIEISQEKIGQLNEELATKKKEE